MKHDVISWYKYCHFGLIDCFRLTRNQNFYSGPCKTYCSIKEYINMAKQIFGYTYIYAPFCNHESLLKHYGESYFHSGDVNDNFHFKDKTVKTFSLNQYEKTWHKFFQLKYCLVCYNN